MKRVAAAVLSMTCAVAAQAGTLTYTFINGFQTDTDSVTWAVELNGFLNEFSVAGGDGFLLNCTTVTSVSRIMPPGTPPSDTGVTPFATAACGASITYTYTANPTNDAPEPGSLALAGLALLGIEVARRRKS